MAQKIRFPNGTCVKIPHVGMAADLPLDAGEARKVKPCPEKLLDNPCAFQGLATGREHKKSCTGEIKFLAEHVCYHIERRWKDREGVEREGLCTPGGSCQAWARIQPCGSCPLARRQRLLD